MLNFILASAKALLRSRIPSPKGSCKERSLIVMGNGPALRQTIDNYSNWLSQNDLLAVNFAANTPEFFLLRPMIYVLADPHFFNLPSSDPNVEKLWKNLTAADWKMSLWIPVSQKNKIRNLPNLPQNITLKFFNLTPGDGTGKGMNWLYKLGVAMPRPRNVLIPSIMIGIREGYKEIFLAGADHTWTRTLSVNDNNRVVSIQPHFYKDSDGELKRVETEYKGLHLHDVLGSMTIAFKSYFDIAAFADSEGVKILNATPGSFIDAFPRFTPVADVASVSDAQNRTH